MDKLLNNEEEKEMLNNIDSLDEKIIKIFKRF